MLLRRRGILCLALFSSWFLGACGEPEGPDLSGREWPIIYGSPDTTQAHQAVVYVASTGGCTGTLIANRVVLTAAHCVHGMTPADTYIGFGNVDQDLVWRYTSEIWEHPYYETQNHTYDLALVRLTNGPPAGVTPIPHLPAGLAVNSGDIGDPIELVGFGQTETGGGGTKLTVTIDLTWICESPGGCSVGGYFANPNTLCYDQSPGGMCYGDSGGPDFIWRSGQEYVAGVNSYIMGSCVEFACATKVDEYESEILDFIGGVPGSSCSIGADCLSGYCVDSVCCQTACTGLCQECNQPGNLGECRTAANGTACPDSDACDGVEICQGGSCVAGTPLNCDDHQACTADSCNPASGCQHAPLTDGTSCSDNNVCNGTETCQAGQCRSPGSLDCGDANPCTADSCDPVSGCLHSTVADGTQCFDGDVCNGAELCQGGVCQPGTPIDCTDSNPCTDDLCDPVSGCHHDPSADNLPCEDNNACTGDGRCQAGVCRQGQPLDCDDLNPCTVDSCQPGTGCLHQPVADGTSCGGGLCGQASCQGGECVGGGSVDCDDSDPCTYDGCDPAQGCVHSAAPDGTACEDGDPCTQADACRNGACASGEPASCDDRNPCTRDSCDAQGCHHAEEVDGTSCGGGLCGPGTCTGGSCVYEDPPNCDDYDFCTEDWCDPATGCQHASLPEGYACAECMACLQGVCTQLADCGEGSGCGCGNGTQHSGFPAFVLLLGLFLSRSRNRA